MNMELHSTGASFVAGKEEHNPRNVVADVIKAMPEAARKERFERFLRLISDDEEYLRAIAWYFFVNMHDYMMTNRSRQQPEHRAERRAQAEQMTERVERIKAQIMLLDLTMPNGKSMRDCTGAEMAKFGNRFQKIAERVGKAKTVGSVLDEDQVKAIMT